MDHKEKLAFVGWTQRGFNETVRTVHGCGANETQSPMGLIQGIPVPCSLDSAGALVRRELDGAVRYWQGMVRNPGAAFFADE